jgi:hypothetical protein
MKALALDDFRIRFNISPQTTELVIRLAEQAKRNLDLATPVKWTGRIRGPFCNYSQTLAANYPLIGSDGGKSARAVIPDFCHWTAELPFTYDLELQCWCEEQLEGELRAKIGAAWVALHRGRLYRSAKRWIPRMARLPIPSSSARGIEAWLEEIRSNDLALVIDANDASDQFLSASQRIGVALAIDVTTDAADSITRYEAAGCAFLLLTRDSLPARIDTSILVATPVESKDGELRHWRIEAKRTASGGLIAERPSEHGTPNDARMECDALQASVAQMGEWAGFLV